VKGRSRDLSGSLQALISLGTIGGLTDEQLLEQLASLRDDGANLPFEVLLRRHGGMVLRVCRGVLGNSTDADDAFQATFLILVRNAHAIRKQASLASWLYHDAGAREATTPRTSRRVAGRSRRAVGANPILAWPSHRTSRLHCRRLGSVL
jgi:HlyD family secretion protein